MAKFVSQSFSDIRGSVGGITYSKNRYGLYTRSKVTPINNQTLPQGFQRALIAANSTNWRSLTDDDRAAWEMIASSLTLYTNLGVAYTPTGFQLYMTENTNGGIIGIPRQDTPSTNQTIPEVTSMSSVIDVSAAPSPGTFVIQYGTLNPNAGMILQVTPPQPPQLNIGSIKNKFTTLFNPATGSPINGNAGTLSTIAGFYDAQFGTDIVGNTPPTGTIWVRIRPVNTTSGVSGAPIIAPSTVVLP